MTETKSKTEHTRTHSEHERDFEELAEKSAANLETLKALWDKALDHRPGTEEPRLAAGHALRLFLYRKIGELEEDVVGYGLAREFSEDLRKEPPAPKPTPAKTEEDLTDEGATLTADLGPSPTAAKPPTAHPGPHATPTARPPAGAPSHPHGHGEGSQGR